MRNLVYYVAVTLDGFIAGPDDSFDFFTFDGDHMQAINDEYPETIPAHVREALGLPLRVKNFDTVVMGRRTLQPALDAGLSSAWPHLRQYVFSRTLSDSVDPSLTVVRTDPRATVATLKREEGLDIWLAGGGALAGALLPDLDQLVFKINPIIIGSGIPLATAQFEPHRFDPASTRTFDSGVTFVTLRRRR